MTDRLPITRRALDRLAVPAIISGIAEPIISLSDTHFAGMINPHDGGMNLTAVGVGSSFFVLVLWVLAQTRSAVLAVVARYFGANKLNEIHDLVPIAIWMNVGLGLLFYGLTVPFAPIIFKIYHLDPAVQEKAVAFYQVRAIGHPIALAVYAMTGAFRGLQNMRWSMWISVMGATVNIGLNKVLIFGLGPIPALGINGSAVASILAQCCMCSAAIYVMYTRTPFTLFPKRWRHPEFFPLLLNSTNLFSRSIALNACYFLGNRFASAYGLAAIGAHTIAMQLWLFSAFFIDGYAAAGSVIAGRLNGERNWKELHRVSWQVVKITMYIGGGLGVLFVVLYDWIGPWFTTDAAVISAFKGVFWIVLLTQPINAVAFAWDGIFKGVGRSAELRNALLVGTFGVFVPTILLADHFGLTLHGIWLAFTLWMVTRGTWLTVAFERRFAPGRHALLQ